MPTTTRMVAELAKICRICRYADGVCATGFRKTHERADPMCRLHGATSRGTVPPTRAKASARPTQEPPLVEQEGEEGHQPKPVGERPETAGHDQMTQFVTRKRLPLQCPPDPLDKWIARDIQMSGQHHGGSTKHRRKRTVRTVPETLPQAMQARGKSRQACAHCRPLHAPNSRRKQNLRHAVSGQAGKDVAKCPRDPQKDPGKEKAATRGSSHTAKRRATRCSDLPRWGRTRSSAMTNVMWKTLLQIGGTATRT